MTAKRAWNDEGTAARPGLERIQLGAVTASVFALPLFMYPGLSDYNYAKSIASLLLISLLMVLWGLTSWKSGKWTIRLPWLAAPILGLIVAGVLSLITATHGGVVLQSLLMLAYFGVLLCMIADLVRDARDVRWILAALLASGLLAAAYGVLQYLGMLPGASGATGVNSIISTMGNRNHLGGFLVYLFFPSTILLLRARTRWTKATVLGLLVGFIIVILLIRQAGGQLALAFGAGAFVVGWVVFRPIQTLRNHRGWLVILWGVALLFWTGTIVMTPPSAEQIVPTDASKPLLVRLWEANSGLTRSWDWQIGLDMFADHPVTGTGLGNYKLEFIRSKADVLASQRGQVYDFEISRASQAHNEYVQTAAELGAVGLAMLLASVATLGTTLWIRLRRGNDRQRADVLLLTVGILTFLVHAVVSFPAHVVGSSLALVVFIGLGLSRAYGTSQSWTLILSGWRGRALHSLLVVCAIAVSVTAIADARANYLMEQGIANIQAGQFGVGEALLQQSLELDFAPRQTHYYLAVAQIQLGKLEDAQENLEKCLTRFVDEAALLNLANLLVNTDQSEQAHEPIDLLLASHPRGEVELRARYLQALAFTETGDTDRGLSLLSTLLDETPHYANGYIGLGHIYETLNDVDGARTAYERGLGAVEDQLPDLRQQLATEGTSPSERQRQLQSQIERLITARATLSDRLRSLPGPAVP